MNIQILRLETSCGKGPYHSRDACDPMRHTPHDYRQPTPYTENMDIDASHFFGFRSKEQLREWFWNRENDHVLVDAGISVSTYEVDETDVIFGDCQVAFVRDKAVKVDRQPLENF